MAKLTRCQFYVSDVAVREQDGEWIQLPDSYLLVDVSKSNTYYVGRADVEEIVEIRFGIGVGELANHLDPATYPPGHPLAHQLPSMHWGWAAGYRFIVAEGLAGSALSGPVTEFQIHTVDDALYRAKVVQTSSTMQAETLMVDLEMQLNMLFHGIPVQYGIINHSSEGEAIRITENMVQRVFTSNATSTVPWLVLRPVHLAPLPAQGYCSVDATECAGDGTSLSIAVLNIDGVEVLRVTTSLPITSISTGMLPSGVYTVHVYTSKRLCGVQRLLVL